MSIKNIGEGRSNISIKFAFSEAKFGYGELCNVYLPYELVVDVAKDFCNTEYNVELKGTNEDIWNLFGDTNFFLNLMTDHDFYEDIFNTYMYSDYVLADREAWRLMNGK